MTVSSQNSRIEQLGDGTTTAFAVNFYFLENSDLKVFVNGVLQTITTNYTVTGAGNPAGGTVTFVSAPANGVEVVIFRDPALTQGLDYIDNDPFPAESHERGLDKLTMIAQRVKDLVSRALRLGDSVVGVNTELPALTGSQLLGTNPGGTGFQLYPLGSTPQDAGSTVYTPAGTGAVATTVQSQLRLIQKNTVFLNDAPYYCLADGTDQSAKIQLAIDNINALGGGEIVATELYRCKNVIMKSNVTLRGRGRGTGFKLAFGAVPDDKVISTNSSFAANGCAVLNLEINGARDEHGFSNNQMNAITIQGNHFNWRVEGCYLHNTGGDGVFVSWANDFATQLPENIQIIGNTIENTARQDISIVHCKDYSIVGNICSGVIDLEPGNNFETNRDGVVSGNAALTINASVFTGLLADDNNLTITGNTVTNMTCFGGNNVTFAGNTIKQSFRYAQSKLIHVIGNTMRKVESIVSNGAFVDRMIFSNNVITNTDAASAAVTLRNFKDLIAENNTVYASGNGSRAVLIDNLDSSISKYRFVGGKYLSSAGDAFYINANTQVNCAVEIEDAYIDSTSNNAVNKDGSIAGGTLSVVDCTCRGNVQVNFHDGLFEVRKTKFLGNCFPRLVNNNANVNLILDDLLFDNSPNIGILLQNSALTRAYIGKMVNLAGSITLDWFGSTNSSFVWFNGPESTVTTWFGTPPGAIKTGSKYYLVDDAVKFGQWYNGTSWVNLT